MTRAKRRYLLALVEGRVCVKCRCAPGEEERAPGWLCWRHYWDWVQSNDFLNRFRMELVATNR
jgi:hypothetical protein